MSAQASGNVRVRPLSGCIGAEIEGVDLHEELSGEQVRVIRQALLDWKAIFFRDQHIGHAEQVAFARRFGELTVGHPLGDRSTAPEGFPEIFQVPQENFVKGIGQKANQEHLWHCDMSPYLNPPMVSMLRGDQVPPYGGDTVWSDLTAAYDGLASAVRTLADSLWAVHTFDFIEQSYAEGDATVRLEAVPHITEHPVVRVHPETGRKALWVTPGFSRRIVGLSPGESRMVLDLFFEAINQPEYTVRFPWRAGSVAMWDNRSAAHRAPGDLHFLREEFKRELYRVTLVGDVPVGPDGTKSRPVVGGPLTAVS